MNQDPEPQLTVVQDLQPGGRRDNDPPRERPVHEPATNVPGVGPAELDDRQYIEHRLTLAPELVANLPPAVLKAVAHALRSDEAVETALEKLRSTNDALRQLAATDRMTQVGNRLAMDSKLASEWRRARRHSRPLTVIMVDIDDLKGINDTGGHASGDAAIISVAQRLAAAMRQEDTIARIGGDEFMVLCPEAGPQEAALIGAKLARAVADKPITTPAGSSHVSVSVGWAALTSEGEEFNDSEALVRAADAHQYQVKRAHSVRSARDTQGERFEQARLDDDGGPPGPGI